MLRRLFLAGLPLTAQSAKAAVRVEPPAPFPGSPILFAVGAKPREAKWMERPVWFAMDESSKEWVALAAVPLDAKPGMHVLDLDGTAHRVRVVPHAYRTGRLTVPPRFVQPPKSVEKRIAGEREVKKAAFAVRSERMWRGAFGAPTDTPQTSPFGTRRVYNGKTRSVHQGLDFRAVVGTTVRATNTGRVAIAQEMYYEGGLVVLDHGEGLFSLYMHLSGFAVQVGDVVPKGQDVGESGSSGRVTGPHLHFAVQWQGLYMEPATLLTLRI
ncbi:MAG: M23 family metallopeptidase [Acidobacteria bacterium]|nr:M23 family metallopeptidase [Acidobacteriota bacterium]